MGILGKIRHKRSVEAGLRAFEIEAQTPQSAFGSLRWRHCDTSGRATDKLAARLARLHPQQHENEIGLFSEEQERALQSLHSDGIYVFERKLPTSVCATLERFARQTPARLYPCPDETPQIAVYDQTNPLAKTYHLEENEILNQVEVQNLLADVSLRNLVREYLSCEPVFDLAAMWWSVPTTEASSAAAQLYHFDLDRVAWLKFFIYLSDVTLSRGPHCYLRGTHRIGESSRKLLAFGDRRISNEEVQSVGLTSLEKEVCGSKGTVFVADTRGHHKGKPPEDGDRLVLELEFASSLFGASYQIIDIQEPAAKLREAVKDAPFVFSKLNLSIRGA